MRVKMIQIFAQGVSVSGIMCYFSRVGFEWLPFIILMMVLYSTYIEIKYINNNK